MNLDIKELSEVFELNKDDLKGNRELTNEMIVDDLMVGLGYNKKRDRLVKRLFGDEPFDWRVNSEDGSGLLLVKTFSWDEGKLDGEPITEITKSDEALSNCKAAIATDGSALKIFANTGSGLEEVTRIDIVDNNTENLDETQEAALEFISKQGFDAEKLSGLIKRVSFSDVLNENLDNIVEIIAEALNDEYSIQYGIEITAEDIRNVISGTQEGTGDITEEAVNEESVQSEGLISQEQLDEELSKLRAEYEEKLAAVQSSNEDNNGQVEAITEEYEAKLSQQEQEYNEKINSLSDENEALVKKAEELTAEIESIKNESNEASESDLLQELSEVKSKLGEAQASIVSKDNIIKTLKQQAGGTGTSGLGGSDEVEDLKRKNQSYVDKIRDYAVQVSTLENDVADLKKQIADKDSEIAKLSGSERTHAEELLACVEDNPDDDRNYVGVVNTQLIQYDEIHTFIGRALQELYEIKGYEASQYIFNGDIFRLDPNAKFSDIVMGDKAYDIHLATDKEDTELNKLREVFSHFDDIVFFCKKLGTLRRNINYREGIVEEKEEKQFQSEDFLDEDDNIDFGTSSGDNQGAQGDFEQGQNDFGIDTENYTDTEGMSSFTDVQGQYMPDDAYNGDQQGFEDSQQGFDTNNQGNFDEFNNTPDESANWSGDSDMGQGYTGEQGYVDEQGYEDGQGYQNDSEIIEQPLEGFDGNWDNQEQEVMEQHLLVGQLLQIDMLIWAEQKIEFRGIKYIGNNDITFGINTQIESRDELLCRCFDAVLAVEAFKSSDKLITRLKSTDFSKANNFIKLASQQYTGCPRLTGTRYVVSGIETVQQVASALLDMCNAMNIGTSDLFLYFDTATNDEYIIENYEFSEDAIRISETSSYEMDPEKEITTGIAILRGDMSNNILITKNSLKAHKEILIGALAVKTNYMSVTVKDPNDAYNAIGAMFGEADSKGVRINFDAIGNVVGESYLIASDNPSKVSKDSVKVDAYGVEIYVSKMENWQLAHAFIRVHTKLFNNTGIAVKVQLNMDALDFYSRNFETSEPSLGLAVCSFADYVQTCVKKI